MLKSQSKSGIRGAGDFGRRPDFLASRVRFQINFRRNVCQNLKVQCVGFR